MWGAHGTQDVEHELRHQAAQDALDEWGFRAHDGRGYAEQVLGDSHNGVKLTTSFAKPDDTPGSWAVRVDAAAVAQAPRQQPQCVGAGCAADGGSTGEQAVFFYLAVDSEFAPAPPAGEMALAQNGGVAREAAVVEGGFDGLEPFALVAQGFDVGGAPIKAPPSSSTRMVSS
jgi:mannosyl-oligosaccharide glucosidase